MKQLLLAVAATLFGLQTAQAQTVDQFGIFDHLGMGVSLGTDGIGIDVAAPITDYAALRAGVSFFPKIKHVVKDVDIDDDNGTLTPTVDIEGKLNIFDFKVLADFYPFKNSSFHLTAGAFLGNEAIVKATNTTMFIKQPEKYGKVGLVLGDYRLTTDANGYANIDFTVSKFKPYLGFGFGRAIPKNSRVSVSCDFGVQFWGAPRLAADAKHKDAFDSDPLEYHKFKYTELDDNDDEDLKDALKTAEKIKVYPVLNIRISGRIF